MIFEPKISVIIPAYNVGNYIQDAVQSVCQQTYKNIEIIVVNDGSTDQTKENLENISDKRIKIINIPNSGVSTARNIGIESSTGNYIAFLDGDDLWKTTHLENAVTAFNQYPEIHWYSSSYTIAENATSTWLNKQEKNNYIISSYFDTAHKFVHSSTVIISRKLIKQLMPLFPAHINNAEDWAAWAKIAFKEQHLILNPCQDVLYRVRYDSATGIGATYNIDKYLLYPYYLLDLSNQESRDNVQLFINEKCKERWQLIISKHSPKYWDCHLNDFRRNIGLTVYLIVKFYITISIYLSRLTCSLIYHINKKYK